MINKIEIAYVDSLLGIMDTQVINRFQFPETFDSYVKHLRDCELPLCNCYYMITLDNGEHFNRHDI